jgi:hypothetical protein
MRFMLLVKASKESEAGVMPTQELLAAMGAFNEEMVKAGVLLAGDGLQASSKGARVKFPSGGRPVVTDGPFAETKELVAGYWLIQVKSKAEAIEWARRSPAPAGPGKDAEIEVRQVFEASDLLREATEAIGHTSSGAS